MAARSYSKSRPTTRTSRFGTARTSASSSMSRASTSASRRSWAPEQSNSANALRLAALHGQGLIMSPMFLVAEEIKTGRLVAILEEFLRDEHAINAIYPHRQHVPAKVRSFIDLLIRYFREHPTWAAQEIDLHAEQVISTARRCATSRAFSQASS